MFFSIKPFDKILDMYFKGYSQQELAKSSVLAAVWTSIFLIAIKLSAWLVTDSISLQASMNDSILDALSSFIAYHALKFSSVSYDKSHNFGHEKVEGIVALFQCMLVIYSGFVICRESYEGFLHPRPISNTGVGITIMVISCVAIYTLVYFQRYTSIRTGSMIVEGDSLHYLSDFFMNMCIMMSLILSRFFVYVDVICGLSVGCYVLYNAFLIVKNALRDLMDECLPLKTQNEISNTISKVPGVKRIKMLRTRSAGMKKYVESRIIVDENISIVDANMISERVEAGIKKMFDNIDVIVKPEP